jgi:hypothetical protein
LTELIGFSLILVIGHDSEEVLVVNIQSVILLFRRGIFLIEIPGELCETIVNERWNFWVLLEGYHIIL